MGTLDPTTPPAHRPPRVPPLGGSTREMPRAPLTPHRH